MSLLMMAFFAYISFANIIPFKYIALIFEILLLIDLILYLSLVFKDNNGIKIRRKIIGYIISTILFLIIILASYYIAHTLSFFMSFGKNSYQEENYIILVKKDSNINSIDEIKNMGYVNQEFSEIDKAKDMVKEKRNLEFIEYEQYQMLMKALMDFNIDSLLIEATRYDILCESINYNDEFKILDKVSVVTKIMDDIVDTNVVKEPFSVYISGIDTYGSIGSVSRSDVNMLVTVNPITKQILMVSIPRDYYVQLHGTSGLKDKLTHAGIYGIDMSISTIEDLLDVEIDYYFRVNFSTLYAVVDAIGGVDVYSEYSFTSSSASGGRFKFVKGYNYLDGRKALSFARERYNLPHGDRDRGINQQAVLDGIVRKVTSPAILTTYTSLLDSLKSTFQTNMLETDIQSLIKMQLNDMASWNITTYSLNGTDSHEETYSTGYHKLYVMIPTQSTVNAAKNMIDLVYSNQILEPSYNYEAGSITNPIEVKSRYSTSEVIVPNINPNSNLDSNDTNIEQKPDD